MNEWQRLEKLIDRMTIPEPNSGCHLWLGDLNSDGYGVNSTPLLDTRLVHRQVWLLAGRTLPHFLTLDHICRTRCCINLDHLQLASNVRNVILMHRRKHAGTDR